MRDDDDDEDEHWEAEEQAKQRWRISKNVNYVDVVCYIPTLFIQNLYCISIFSVTIQCSVLVMSLEPN